MALSDVPTALIERCQAGEGQAFDELFAMIHDDLFRWTFSLLRNEDDALEVTQECFIRIFRHLNRLENPAKFPHWVSRLLINQTNTFRVKRRRHQTEELEEGFDVQDDSLPLQGKGIADPRTASQRREVLDRVNEAINDLPPRQRIAVLLFDVKGHSIRQIAEHLDCSEGAVKFNIFQGRRKLRTMLGDYVDKNGNLSLME